MGTIIFYLGIIGAIILAMIIAVDAAELRAKADQVGEQACIQDYFAYCSGATTHEAIHDCFMTHRANVSPACMAVVRKYHKEVLQ